MPPSKGRTKVLCMHEAARKIANGQTDGNGGDRAVLPSSVMRKEALPLTAQLHGPGNDVAGHCSVEGQIFFWRHLCWPASIRPVSVSDAGESFALGPHST